MENKNMMDLELENVTGGAAFADNYYIVKKGDTLSGIAAKHHTTLKNLQNLNPQIKNPNLIYPGDAIRLY